MKAPLVLDTPVTPANFDEAGYLAANPDVADAVERGEVRSGYEHYQTFGRNERRRLDCRGLDVPPPPESRLARWRRRIFGRKEAASGRETVRAALAAAKAAKLARIEPLLRADMRGVRKEGMFDFLSADLRTQFGIVDTDNVSSNNYDRHVLEMIGRHAGGLVLDCGAGRRSVYYDNVVNFDVVPYETTDVRGVGEALPFVDGAFDAVISIAVLEHVKDPFQCAREIARVLKPGGEIICCVAFLQPYHGYPHHYYNMTHQGVANLFAGDLDVERVEVYGSVAPIRSLTWIVQSWAAGLSGDALREFKELKVADLMEPPGMYGRRSFVTALSAEKNRELAAATVLFGRKPR